ncbi:MAG: SAM-dependent methyltransferase [Thiotrichaceae bacterium]|nr:SAM-dependent methyltransferase [Thiotrichaceae bacterium]
MKVATTLSPPPNNAIIHSQKLCQHIAEAIAPSGSIPFRQFMEMALYEPALGYYVAGQRKLGSAGDFITAPEISPLFSQCLAEQCAEVLDSTVKDILEFGAGSGIMASHILLHLESLNQLPKHYYIIDLSPDLIALQKQTLASLAPHLVNKVTWLNDLSTLKNFNGIILGNEVLDAMPIELFTLDKNNVMQTHVTMNDHQFKLIQKTANKTMSQQVRHRIERIKDDYTSEFNPNIDSWIEQLANILHRGLILLIDYGYTRREYYHPDRTEGTLICHYRHQVHHDPLWYPSLQDITANVDFTHIAEAADNSGLTVAGFTNQASFLINSGLEKLFSATLERAPDQSYQLAQQVRTLSLPSEMGDRFHVMALTKKIQSPLSGFSSFDMKHKL